MPRGVKKTLSDRLYDIAQTASVDEFVTACAEVVVTSLKDNSSGRLHEIFGEMNVRAQAMSLELRSLEAKRKAVTRAPRIVKPKSLPAITKVTTRKKPGRPRKVA
jgi:hypothetical protein